jgi:hypothetical protein
MTDLNEAIDAQLDELRERGELEVRPEPRCRVCKDEQTRVLVNKLLAHGLTLRDINDVVAPLNKEKLHRDRVNINNLREHRKRHFDVQRPANAVYRAIVEQRAKELNLDYEHGIGTAVTHLAYLDTMIAEGYETLINEETVISARDGLDAAMKLNEITRQDAGVMEQARIMAEMDRVISVVREVCTPEQLAIMGERLKDTKQQNEQPVPVVSQRPSYQPEPYDPNEDNDDDFDDD